MSIKGPRTYISEARPYISLGLGLAEGPESGGGRVGFLRVCWLFLWVFGGFVFCWDFLFFTIYVAGVIFVVFFDNIAVFLGF